MAKDLRSFLADAEKANKLYRITKEVDPTTQLGALADESDRALLIENVKGFDGWKIASNFNHNRDMEMVCMGVDTREEVLTKLAAAIDAGPTPLNIIENPACQSVVTLNWMVVSTSVLVWVSLSIQKLAITIPLGHVCKLVMANSVVT